ncbi:uncharacterized protein LOC108904047 isoform X2 [Anoplophora glabripennis]|uniref:uncharacterized protein LOC108904047 isoform X2 n=1 Tax=Anoplophora glabripennis TaxID=217634 RepID=UPI0008753D2D|nr:uncharacterized protein LOC108904047 isoform X2 [Anoplophora glabripennis]
MPGDALYWNPVEADSEESLDYPSKEPYVDPWDLENYAYIREHLDSMELSSNPSAPSGSSGEFAEANSHSFYYVPGNGQVGPPYVPNVQEKRRYDSVASEQENYAAIDEVKMYDRRRTRSEVFGPSRRGRYSQEYESVEESLYELGTFKENPIFGIYDQKGRFRRVALPISYSKSVNRDRSLSFAYGDYEYDPYSGPRADIYSKLDEISDEKEQPPPTYQHVHRSRGKPENFGLSQYGHLKIDYSYSWNNLNKYIKYT